MLDYYALRTEVKATLLRQWQQIDIATDPLVWAWIAHALSTEGVANNLVLDQALDQGRRWLDSPDAWSGDSYVSGIGLLCATLARAKNENCDPIISKLVERVQKLHERGLSKFSKLNDPDFVFGVAIGIGKHPVAEVHAWLVQHCERNVQSGNWRRAVLFAASAHELGGRDPSFTVDGTKLEVHEIFPVLWGAERYSGFLKDEETRRGIWEAFERVREGVNLEAALGDGETLYPASPIDVAMLYEALLCQTRQIDPVTLFDNIPWHPSIRQAAEGLFTKGEYVMAVFQASVVFIDSVKGRTHHPVNKSGKPLDGVDLMVHVFGSKSPVLKLNDLKTQADENEQRGLACIAEGIVSAVRNPKGHVPQGNIALGPYEALEQLATISYLMRRLDAAQF